MPAWGQIMSSQQVAKILPYIQDGPKGKALPAPAGGPDAAALGRLPGCIGQRIARGLGEPVMRCPA